MEPFSEGPEQQRNRELLYAKETLHTKARSSSCIAFLLLQKSYNFGINAVAKDIF